MRVIILSFLVAGYAAREAPKDTELPAVTSMMNASSSTLGKISKHVAKIGSRMNDMISAQQTELASQKADFEKQLKAQADFNAKLEAQNEKESSEIWDLEKKNDNLRSQAKTLEKQNANLRKAFATVESKVGAVDQFADKVLKATDDSGNAALAVLSSQKESKDSDSDQDSDASSQDATKDGDADQDAKDADAASTKDVDSAPAKDDDSASAKDDDTAPAKDDDSAAAKEGDEDAQPAANATATEDSDDKDTSFLAIRSKTRRTRSGRRDDDDDNSDNNDDSDNNQAEDSKNQDDSQNATSDSDSVAADPSPPPADHKSFDMVAELKKEITQLSQQQDSSRAELTKLFQARFKKGADKKAQILEKQKLLSSTKASLTKLHTELEGAVKHLQGTKSKLENQLHGLGHYLAQLASYVNKPAADAEKALPALPSDVQTFLQSKA